MNLYVEERNRILQGSAKPVLSKSILLRLQGIEADSAFSLACPLLPSANRACAHRRSITNSKHDRPIWTLINIVASKELP
jgi:hypothetical protein